MNSYFTLDTLTQVKDYSEINKIHASSSTQANAEKFHQTHLQPIQSNPYESPDNRQLPPLLRDNDGKEDNENSSIISLDVPPESNQNDQHEAIAVSIGAAENQLHMAPIEVKH